jgi:hypothetical protein
MAGRAVGIPAGQSAQPEHAPRLAEAAAGAATTSVTRVPAFRVRGRIVAGFAAFKDHLSYLPFSGSVLGQLGDELEGYTMTKERAALPGR